MLALLLAGLLAAALLSACAKPREGMSAAELLELGEKYLLEAEYEQAVLHFIDVTEVDPMDPRGYTGAAQAYAGLGRKEEAAAILEAGLAALPGNVQLQLALVEQEPRRLFEQPLTADQIVFAGVPFWECSFERVQGYYPGGSLLYKDDEGRLRDAEGNFIEGEMGWDRDYLTDEIQYAAEGNRRYAGFRETAVAVRGLTEGMGLDEALGLLGFSPDGVAYVKNAGDGFTFEMDESNCTSVRLREAYSSYDFSLGFSHELPGVGRMYYNICFRNDAITLLEITFDLED